MDPQSIVVITFGVILALTLLVLAGVVLSARVFTTLAELIASLGSSATALTQAHLQALTALSEKTGNVTSSQTINSMPTESVSQTK